MRDVDHNETMAEMYAEDPEFAAELIQSLLEDGQPGETTVFLRQFCLAFGGLSAVAQHASMDSSQLQELLDAGPQAPIDSLRPVLHALDAWLHLSPVKAA